ncbi:DUF551 domain-containing protein [Chitinophaga sp. GCM10012297]|uniref:DUF551 domain-containing protein n=1 Tax=Chitinophaga chungangae TaxID=2821488 RepID=A0ABS3YB35_9BACT|nr:DUF551 domain-containing protein [Chitinophaga chungangae]MBO9151895.1 DUF551 domain-containing protein [Chitinophaga chungangae]
MSNEQNRPMTPEDVQAERDMKLANLIAIHSRQMEHDGGVKSFKAGFRQGYDLHAIQTAFLSEKVKELEEGMIRGYKVGTMAYIPFERIAWKDARIAELEENYRQLAEDRDDLKSKVDVMSTAQGNIVRELEAVKKERDEAKRALEYERKVAYETSKKNADMIVELEAVKKEKNDLFKIENDLQSSYKGAMNDKIIFEKGFNAAKEATDKAMQQLSEVTRQRDEWENFKCQLAAYLMECNYKCTGAEVSDFIDEFSPRISSGETKPVREKERNECEQERDRARWLLSRYLEYAESGCIQGMEDDELSEDTRNFLNGNALPVSPWISVEDRLPEKKGYYIAMCLAPYKEPGLIHYHKNTGWQNGFYECSHWMPLPAPPESLTDKK